MSAPEYIAGFSVFAILIFFSKKASLAEIGELTFANTMGQLIASILGVALLTTMRRDFVVDTKLSEKYVISFYIIRFLISLLVFTIALLVFEFNFLSKIILVMIAARSLDSLSETNYYDLISKDNILKFSLVKSLHYSTLIISVVVGIYLNLNLYQITYIFLLNSLAWCIINFILLYVEKNIDKEFIFLDTYQKNLFRRAFPLLLSSSVYLISTRMNILIVKKLCNPEDFGLFSIIITILGIFSIFTSAISSFLINKQVDWFKVSMEKLKSNSIKITIPFFFAGILIFIITYFASNYINVLFKNFNMSHLWLLKISLISIVIYFIQIPFNYLFTIVDKNKIALYFSVFMIISAAVLYYPLTYKFGLTGSVFAFLSYNILWCSCLVALSMYIVKTKY